MDIKTARLAVSRRLRFGDERQIAAYDHLERVTELEEVLDYLLEGDGSEAHFGALRDVLANHWSELTSMRERQPPGDADAAAA